jgi:E3 SUMO-protein ligase PIAS1
MLSERSAKILAMDYVANQTVALVDSDDEGEGKASTGECNSLTLSLVCPTSKTLIETPVRGRNCKHLQCFDLRNYLRINEPVCGGRCCIHL